MFGKKNRFAVVIILALSLTLAACGGSNSSNSNNAGSNNSSSPSPSAGSGSSGPAAVTILANSQFPDSSHITANLYEFRDKVAELTDGKLKIDVQASGALGFNGNELLSAVRDNLITISEYQANGVVGDEPNFNIASLPFLIRDFDEAKLFHEIALPFYDKVTQEKWNQKILYVNPWPASGFWTQNEITTLEGFKGAKMRTFDENGSRVVESFGGTPHQIPFAELYNALSTGIVDSVMTSSPTAVDGKFWEVLDYYVPAAVTMGIGLVAINLDEFNKLDPSYQEALVNAGKEMNQVVWSRVAEIDEQAVKTSVDNGIKVLPPSNEMLDGLADLTKNIREQVLSNVSEDGKAVVEQFLKEVGRS